MNSVRDDDGLSLIETIVAIGIVIVVLVGFGAVLATTQRSLTADGLRAAGRSVAAQDMEALRVLPWGAVGFYATDADYRPVVNGEPTVTLTTSPRHVGTPAPTQNVVRNGVTYRIERSITWRADPANGIAAPTGTEYNYKRLQVLVRWTLPDGASRTVELENFRAPNSDEQTPPFPAAVPPPGGTAPSPYKPKNVTCTGGDESTLSGVSLSPQDPAVVKITPLGFTRASFTVSYTGLAPSSQAAGYPRIVKIGQSTSPRSFTSNTMTIPAYSALGKAGEHTVVVQGLPRTGKLVLRTCTYSFLYLEESQFPPSSRTPPPPDSVCYGPTGAKWPVESVVSDKSTIQLDSSGNLAEPFTLTYTGMPPEEQRPGSPRLNDIGTLAYSSKYADSSFTSFSYTVPAGRGPIPAGRQIIEVLGINPSTTDGFGFGHCQIAVNFSAAPATGPVTITFQGVYARGFSEPANDQLLPANQQNIFVEPENECIDSWTNRLTTKKWAVPQLWRRPDSGGRFTPVLRYRVTGLGGGSGGIPEVLTTDTDYGPIPLTATSDPEIFYILLNTDFAANQQRYLCQEETYTPRGQPIFNSASSTFSVRAYRASDGQFATDSQVIPIRRTWCYQLSGPASPCSPPPYPTTD